MPTNGKITIADPVLVREAFAFAVAKFEVMNPWTAVTQEIKAQLLDVIMQTALGIHQDAASIGEYAAQEASSKSGNKFI